MLTPHKNVIDRLSRLSVPIVHGNSVYGGLTISQHILIEMVKAVEGSNILPQAGVAMNCEEVVDRAVRLRNCLIEQMQKDLEKQTKEGVN